MEDRSLQRKNDQMKGCASKIDQVKECFSKIDQLQCIRIAVDRLLFFFKRTSLFDLSFKRAF